PSLPTVYVTSLRDKYSWSSSAIWTYSFPGAFRLNAGFLHNQTADFYSVNGTMFSSFPAFQRCKVRPYATDIHGVPFCYESGFYAGAFRLNARFLHNQTADSNSVNGTMLSSFPAFQRYMLHLYAID